MGLKFNFASNWHDINAEDAEDADDLGFLHINRERKLSYQRRATRGDGGSTQRGATDEAGTVERMEREVEQKEVKKETCWRSTEVTKVFERIHGNT